jgi:hypothetical protein
MLQPLLGADARIFAGTWLKKNEIHVEEAGAKVSLPLPRVVELSGSCRILSQEPAAPSPAGGYMPCSSADGP